MDTTVLATWGIIIATIIVSFVGFKDGELFESWRFEVDAILVRKEYKRLVTSGFLHVSWSHLLFNMLSLYIFSHTLSYYLRGGPFLLIYLASMICGNLLALYIHRFHEDYSAVGASGAVSGIIFAAIATFPNMEVGFFFFPIRIKAWLFGLLYVAGTLYAIKAKRDNIGHEAHLGGAIAGMIIAILMAPEVLRANYLPILLVLGPCLIFLWLVATRPAFLLVDKWTVKDNVNYTLEDRYNASRQEQQQEIDRILDKIHEKGIKSLTRRERQTLGMSKAMEDDNRA